METLRISSLLSAGETRTRTPLAPVSLRVGFDLDGVWHDFAASLRTFLVTYHADRPFGDGTYPEPTNWDFWKDWGMTLNEFLQACHEGVDAGIVFNHDPHPGTRAVFDAIHAAGHTIHIATDRPFGTNGASETLTRSWLDRHKLHFDSLTFTADKTVVKADIFIEDKPENYVSLAKAGTEVWLVDRPWNAYFIASRRLRDIREFPDKVARLSERCYATLS